jgi:hypothetical protein
VFVITEFVITEFHCIRKKRNLSQFTTFYISLWVQTYHRKKFSQWRKYFRMKINLQSFFNKQNNNFSLKHGFSYLSSIFYTFSVILEFGVVHKWSHGLRGGTESMILWRYTTRTFLILSLMIGTGVVKIYERSLIWNFFDNLCDVISEVDLWDLMMAFILLRWTSCLVAENLMILKAKIKFRLDNICLLIWSTF